MAVGGDPRADRDSLEVLRVRVEGPDLKYPVEVRLGGGTPPPRFLELARGTECGLIVMGTHGRTGMDRFLVGSVAEAAFRNAPCPVLAVRVSELERAGTPHPPIEKAVTLN